MDKKIGLIKLKIELLYNLISVDFLMIKAKLRGEPINDKSAFKAELKDYFRYSYDIKRKLILGEINRADASAKLTTRYLRMLTLTKWQRLAFYYNKLGKEGFYMDNLKH
jgi:hypothetical protein